MVIGGRLTSNSIASHHTPPLPLPPAHNHPAAPTSCIPHTCLLPQPPTISTAHTLHTQKPRYGSPLRGSGPAPPRHPSSGNAWPKAIENYCVLVRNISTKPQTTFYYPLSFPHGRSPHYTIVYTFTRRVLCQILRATKLTPTPYQFGSQVM